ncbi:MAG: methyltransferase domain-containing protein [Pseudomonadales bacterium]|nr:methyltransferase domain-containing protein [Pseudomonadales bacterium]
MTIKKIAASGKLLLKSTLIKNIVRGKKVVHVGCVDDHFEMIQYKKEKGFYLHDIISATADECIGIDINEPLVRKLNEAYGINNIAIANAEKLQDIHMDGISRNDLLKKLASFDTIMLPDLIEHLNNPGDMLAGMKTIFNKDARIYICTPNPFFISNFILTLFRREIYSPYHTIYFTTESMAVLLGRYGIRIVNTYPCFVPKIRSLPVRIADRILLEFFCLISKGFAENFMYECVFDDTLSINRVHQE